MRPAGTVGLVRATGLRIRASVQDSLADVTANMTRTVANIAEDVMMRFAPMEGVAYKVHSLI